MHSLVIILYGFITMIDHITDSHSLQNRVGAYFKRSRAKKPFWEAFESHCWKSQALSRMVAISSGAWWNQAVLFTPFHYMPSCPCLDQPCLLCFWSQSRSHCEFPLLLCIPCRQTGLCQSGRLCSVPLWSYSLRSCRARICCPLAWLWVWCPIRHCCLSAIPAGPPILAL